MLCTCNFYSLHWSWGRCSIVHSELQQTYEIQLIFLLVTAGCTLKQQESYSILLKLDAKTETRMLSFHSPSLKHCPRFSKEQYLCMQLFSYFSKEWKLKYQFGHLLHFEGINMFSSFQDSKKLVPNQTPKYNQMDCVCCNSIAAACGPDSNPGQTENTRMLKMLISEK